MVKIARPIPHNDTIFHFISMCICYELVSCYCTTRYSLRTCKSTKDKIGSSITKAALESILLVQTLRLLQWQNYKLGVHDRLLQLPLIIAYEPLVSLK